MAVKIDTNHLIYVINPQSPSFSMDEICEVVGPKAEPLCFEHFWLVYDSDGIKNKKPLNQIASIVFGSSIYGDVIAVPSVQMPADFNLYDENESTTIYQPSDIDNGVILTIKKSLEYYRSNIIDGSMQEEFTFDSTANFDNKETFYYSIYNYIEKNPKSFIEDNILFSDLYLRVKLDDNTTHEKLIQDLIEFFIELEDYEKCSVLKKLFIDK